MKLPEADEIFARYFDRWYDDEDRRRKGFDFTRPDLVRRYQPGLNGSEISALGASTQAESMHRVSTMADTAVTDWCGYLQVTEPLSEHWIEAFDRFYSPARIHNLIRTSDPEDFSNELLVTICQLGSVLGAMLHQAVPRLQWIPDWPYWESGLYDPRSGYTIHPFRWAIKKFSASAVNDGQVDKVHACISILNEKAR